MVFVLSQYLFPSVWSFTVIGFNTHDTMNSILWGVLQHSSSFSSLPLGQFTETALNHNKTSPYHCSAKPEFFFYFLKAEPFLPHKRLSPAMVLYMYLWKVPNKSPVSCNQLRVSVVSSPHSCFQQLCCDCNLNFSLNPVTAINDFIIWPITMQFLFTSCLPP